MIRLHGCIFSLPLWNKACYQSVVLSPDPTPILSLSLSHYKNVVMKQRICILYGSLNIIHRDEIHSYFVLCDLPFFIDHVCSTVSFMLSGLETRSLGHNVVSSLFVASLGRANESLFAASWSHNQDSRHTNIWQTPFKNLLLWNRQVDFHETWYVALGTPAHHKWLK